METNTLETKVLLTNDNRDSRERFKFLVTGTPKCGKSSLIRRLSDNEFIENLPEEKVKKVISTKIGWQAVTVELEEIDLCYFSGSENGNKEEFYDWLDVNSVLFLYDRCDESSFKELKRELEIVQRKVAPNCNICLIGTKSDKKVAISWVDAEAFAEEKELSLFEVSAKTGINCEIIITETVDSLLERIHDVNQIVGDINYEQPIYQDTVIMTNQEKPEEREKLNLFCWVPKIPFLSRLSN